ncbi:hypothetical protein M404DRAFT_994148 [Pisolithus tinctorius Marx 270]|uniref:Uncharacterized protein n=1 Tax=Pisolithus tinctorius Marx 270 TaxID=870435 RepID=A0A0C3PSN2_PISTI|nr:hypothetical protein M404DRAFT_994148 [Pisolithus tinctorius Marx 270]
MSISPRMNDKDFSSKCCYLPGGCEGSHFISYCPRSVFSPELVSTVACPCICNSWIS